VASKSEQLFAKYNSKNPMGNYFSKCYFETETIINDRAQIPRGRLQATLSSNSNKFTIPSTTAPSEFDINDIGSFQNDIRGSIYTNETVITETDTLTVQSSPLTPEILMTTTQSSSMGNSEEIIDADLEVFWEIIKSHNVIEMFDLLDMQDPWKHAQNQTIYSIGIICNVKVAGAGCEMVYGIDEIFDDRKNLIFGGRVPLGEKPEEAARQIFEGKSGARVRDLEFIGKVEKKIAKCVGSQTVNTFYFKVKSLSSECPDAGNWAQNLYPNFF
jgi:hypothetical protein